MLVTEIIIIGMFGFTLTTLSGRIIKKKFQKYKIKRRNKKRKLERAKRIIKKYTYGVEEKKDKEEICVICQEDYKNNKKVVKILCSHEYHPQCILEWFKHKPFCPLCKMDMNKINKNN